MTAMCSHVVGEKPQGHKARRKVGSVYSSLSGDGWY